MSNDTDHNPDLWDLCVYHTIGIYVISGVAGVECLIIICLVIAIMVRNDRRSRRRHEEVSMTPPRDTDVTDVTDNHVNGSPWVRRIAHRTDIPRIQITGENEFETSLQDGRYSTVPRTFERDPHSTPNGFVLSNRNQANGPTTSNFGRGHLSQSGSNLLTASLRNQSQSRSSNVYHEIGEQQETTFIEYETPVSTPRGTTDSETSLPFNFEEPPQRTEATESFRRHDDSAGVFAN